MYVGRIVAIAKNQAGQVAALYRVSSRSFPNRQAKVLADSVAIVPKPGHEDDIYKNPYIAYNCVKIVGKFGLATNGSHTDFIADKLAAGTCVRDALASVLLTMDYEHDSLNTPRIAAVVDRVAGNGYLGIVTDHSLLVREFELKAGEAYYVATYERDVPNPHAHDPNFDAPDAAAACAYILGQGVFADFERPISAACLVANEADGYDMAIADAAAE